MRTDNPKIMIPLIRKAIPKLMAEEIVGVQPMTAPPAEIFTVKTNILNPWTKWRKTTSFWPRKSINGKWVFGFINKRGRTVWEGAMHGKGKRKREFASNKELFAWKLKGDE